MFTEPETWVAIAFVILMVLFAYLGVHRTVLTALDHRAERIKAELDEARRLKEDAAKLLAADSHPDSIKLACGGSTESSTTDRIPSGWSRSVCSARSVP